MLRLCVDVTHVDVEDLVTELDCISHNVECGFTSGLGWEITEVEADEDSDDEEPVDDDTISATCGGCGRAVELDDSEGSWEGFGIVYVKGGA